MDRLSIDKKFIPKKGKEERNERGKKKHRKSKNKSTLHKRKKGKSDYCFIAVPYDSSRKHGKLKNSNKNFEDRSNNKKQLKKKKKNYGEK